MNAPTRLEEAFAENFDCCNELGASVSVWKDGAEIFSLNRGYTATDQAAEWTARTLVPVFSATKGISAATFLLALHRAGQTPDMAAGELWPSFPLSHARLSQVLSHQCGLAALAHPADLFDHAACVAAIEETSPAWMPPEHGYHPHTFGPIIDELMLRLTGETIAAYWERELRGPLGIDFYLKLPEREFGRVATLYPAKADKEELGTPFYLEYMKPGTRIFNSFRSLTGLGSVRSMNTPKAWTCGSPALGGVASAQGMAAFYQACLGQLNGNGPCSPDEGLIPQQVTDWMKTFVIDGPDLTMLTPTAFSCGMMLDPVDPETGESIRNLFGIRGFGHAGAGGSHAFADPATGVSFGYAMNHMDLSVLPGKKTQRLLKALHDALAG